MSERHQLQHNIPAELRNRSNWLVANADKIPVKPQSSDRICGDRVGHMMPFDQALNLIEQQQHECLILCHTRDDPIITLDIDNCIDPDAQLQNWITPLIQNNALGYVEYSSSGTGLHIPCRAAGDKPFRKRVYFPDPRQYDAKWRAEQAGKMRAVEVMAIGHLSHYTGHVAPFCTDPHRVTDFNPVLEWLNQHWPIPDDPEPHQSLSRESSNHPHDKLSADDLREMLACISPDLPNDEWVRIGMALHDWDEIEGVNLWNSWSQCGDKYKNETDLRTRWKSFKPGEVTVATLIHMAKEGGYQHPARTQCNRPPSAVKPAPATPPPEKHDRLMETRKPINISPESLLLSPFPLPRPGVDWMTPDEAVQLLNRKFVHVVHGGKTYVACTGYSATRNPELRLFTIKSFGEMFLSWPPVYSGFNSKGEPKYESPAKSWLNHENKNFCPQGITFHPVNETFYRDQFNPYYGFGVQPVACETGEILPWLQHTKDVICNGNEEHYQYVLNWLAHMIQKPEEKPGVAVILYGGQGTGKGSFVAPLGQIMGSHYLYADRSDLLTGKFNAICENKTLIFADEAYFGAGTYKAREAAKRLKTKVTEPLGIIERKNVDACAVPDFSRVIMATNNPDVLEIEADDRRYLYLEVSDQYKQDAEYFMPLRAMIEKGQLAPKLLYFLQQRDISNFNPTQVPKTKALTEQKIDWLTPELQFVYEILQNDGRTPDGEQLFGLPISGTDGRVSTILEWDTKYIQKKFRQWLDESRLSFRRDIPRTLGRALSKVGVKRGDDPHLRVYQFIKLAQARLLFERDVVNGAVDWETSDPLCEPDSSVVDFPCR